MICKTVIERNYRKNTQRLWNIETTGHDFLATKQLAKIISNMKSLDPLTQAADSPNMLPYQKKVIITISQ